MSTIKAANVLHPSATSGLALDASGNATLAGTLVAGSSMGWRNRLINSEMRIAQRGTSFTPGTGLGAYTLDRWEYNAFNATGAYSVAQSSVVPNGNFTNSALLTVTTPATPSGTDYYFFQQKIEGYNVADLGWGTANAQSVTVSFWVRSSVTGTYGFHLINAATTLSYVATYTISAANTWQYVTLTVPGPTTGTWNTTNGVGIFAGFDLGAGASRQTTANTWSSGASFFCATSGTVNWISTTGATFYLTGVQLEPGTVATPFERRDFGRELAMCQRYYEAAGGDVYTGFGGSSVGSGTWSVRQYISFNVIKRAIPTMSYTNVRANWSAYNIALNLGGFSSECGTSTATPDPRPNFQWQANAEL